LSNFIDQYGCCTGKSEIFSVINKQVNIETRTLLQYVEFRSKNVDEAVPNWWIGILVSLKRLLVLVRYPFFWSMCLWCYIILWGNIWHHALFPLSFLNESLLHVAYAILLTITLTHASNMSDWKLKLRIA